MPDAIDSEQLPAQVGYDDDLLSVQDPGEDDEHVEETVSDNLCRNFTVVQTKGCTSCQGGWSQMRLQVETLDVEVVSWCAYMWSAGVKPVGCTALIQTALETTYGSEMNIQLQGNSCGGYPCSQLANDALPQTVVTSVANCTF